MNTALLIARLFFGLGLAAHGSQKLFGWFGGHGLSGTGDFFETIGFRPGRFFATAAASGEVAGGLLTALGLFGPVGPALMILVMIVAASIHARNGFFASNNGVELPLLYAMGGLVFAFVGPGAYSLDGILGLLWLSSDQFAIIGVGLAFVAAALVIAARQVLAHRTQPAT